MYDDTEKTTEEKEECRKKLLYKIFEDNLRLRGIQEEEKHA